MLTAHAVSPGSPHDPFLGSSRLGHRPFLAHVPRACTNPQCPCMPRPSRREVHSAISQLTVYLPHEVGMRYGGGYVYHDDSPPAVGAMRC